MNVLVGDIGGTHTRLAIAEVGLGAKVFLNHGARFTNSPDTPLNVLLHQYLGQVPRPHLACLAVAGPTDGHSVALTNLGWKIDAQELGAELDLPLHLINDFAAVGWGVDAVDSAQIRTLQNGACIAHAPRVVLGAGTGLGVAICAAQDGHYRPLPGEGGHMAFAPQNAAQDDLLKHLRPQFSATSGHAAGQPFDRVSAERIVSGSGVLALYHFQCTQLHLAPHCTTPEAVSQAALAATDPAAMAALHLFAEIYAQVAGDLALIAGGRGGVYLAGGIASQILPFIDHPNFVTAFTAKGRFTRWMQDIPLHVVLDPDIGLKGAAVASQHAHPHP